MTRWVGAGRDVLFSDSVCPPTAATVGMNGAPAGDAARLSKRMRRPHTRRGRSRRFVAPGCLKQPRPEDPTRNVHRKSLLWIGKEETAGEDGVGHVAPRCRLVEVEEGTGAATPAAPDDGPLASPIAPDAEALARLPSEMCRRGGVAIDGGYLPRARFFGGFGLGFVSGYPALDAAASARSRCLRVAIVSPVQASASTTASWRRRLALQGACRRCGLACPAVRAKSCRDQKSRQCSRACSSLTTRSAAIRRVGRDAR